MSIYVYIKLLSGDIIPIAFEPDNSIRNKNLLFKVQSLSLFKDYPVERILLYHNDFIDLSNIKNGDIINLFICEPYEDSWLYSQNYDYKDKEDKEYKKYTINLYNEDKLYFYNKERKSSIPIYIFMRKNDNHFKVTTYSDLNLNDNKKWHYKLYDALIEFQSEYNNINKHIIFTDNKLIHLYHLWNLNT